MFWIVISVIFGAAWIGTPEPMKKQACERPAQLVLIARQADAVRHGPRFPSGFT